MIGQTGIKQNLALMFLSLLCVFLVGELGVRSYDALRGFGFFTNKRNRLSTSIKPILPFRTFGFKLYREHEGKPYISSSHGELYTLDKPTGTVRIVCFGGSTTANMQQFKAEGNHYPLTLQSLLRERFKRDNIEVINVGRSAYATPHSLILLELDVLEWNPDIVIISHNINDLIAMYWPDFTFDYSNKYSHEFYNVPNYYKRFTLMNLVFQHSALYWFVWDRLADLQNSSTFKPLQRRSYGPEPNPEAIRIFQRNLESFITLAKRNGIHVLLSTQPHQASEEYFVRHYAQKPYNDIVIYPEHDEFIRHHSAYNEMIEKVARENDVEFLDNNELFGGRKEFFTDVVHYTRQGVQRLAHNYADFLVTRSLIK